MICINCGTPVRITYGLGTGELITVHAATMLTRCGMTSKPYAESADADADDAIERAESAAQSILDEANAS